MFEPDPPGQQPMMMMTTACTGCTWKASDKAKAEKGMMPNWQRKPMMMPQGLLRWANSFVAFTVQPMANMIRASMTVSTVLNARPSTALKLLGGMRQSVPEQTVARGSQPAGTAVVMVEYVSGEEEVKQGVPIEETLQFLSFLRDYSSFSPPLISKTGKMTVRGAQLSSFNVSSCQIKVGGKIVWKKKKIKN